jgi:CDP-paratose 2-epimerase
VGSNVAAAYLRSGHRVTVLDNLYRPGTERNLQWLKRESHPERLEFILGDVRDAALVHRVIGVPDVRLVFHFAAQTAVTTSIARPREDLEMNLLGTFNVLEAVRRSEAATPPVLFFTSTNKVYGSLGHLESLETDTRYRFADHELHHNGVSELEPLDFHSPYGCSKGAADQYVRDYSRMYGLRTVVFRMSCIYGPRQFGNEDQGWLAHFLIAAASGGPLTIYGSGKQVRDLLYVDDLVRAFELAAENIDVTAGNVYNIGGGPGNSISIWRELRPRLEALCGKPVRPRTRSWRPGDQPIYVSDTRAARGHFGWTPRVSVDEGLGRLWAWIQEHRRLFEQPGEAAAQADERVAAVRSAGGGVRAGNRA